MAELAEAEPVPSSSDGKITVEKENEEGPTPEKRRKVDDGDQEKLENRLGGILCCAVCLDLPQSAVYQCSNGHLMCAACFTHLLADARLRDEAATCPNCRVEISKTSASRNLAVEKTVSELPSECRYCARVYPRHSLQHHEENTCDDRLSQCQYWVIGCGWRGPQHERPPHEERCSAPAGSARELLPVLAERHAQHLAALKVHDQLVDLLSYEKITFSDLQLKPYRTEEFVNKLYYESSRFAAFGQQWVVKAFVNRQQRDPTQSYEREIEYQLVLKSKAGAGLGVQWVALRGPTGGVGLTASLAAHCFTEPGDAAPLQPLPLKDHDDTNRLLANKAIHFRLVMFLSSK